MKKLGLFFGAGAEIGYGLPSGGRFALEIFQVDSGPDKELFSELVSKIEPTSNYAKWLPEGYATKRVWTFGKREYRYLVESTLEQRKADLIQRLDDFDSIATQCLASAKFDEQEIVEAVEELVDAEIGASSFSHVVKLNQALGANTRLFESDYFSTLLQIVSQHKEATRLRMVVLAVVQLLVAAHGHSLVNTLTHELFTKLPDDLDFLDEVSAVFQLDLKDVGAKSLEVLLENPPTSSDEPLGLVTDFAVEILAELMASALDYQALIDEYFRYLFNPRAHWAKFTRIAVFLYTVRRYISEKLTSSDHEDKIARGPGYYHDLGALGELGVKVEVVGTSNYNTFVDACLQAVGVEATVVRLNGGVSDFYDPYANRLDSDVQDLDSVKSQGRILVPFILTQSGTKPLTSIEMSKRFTSLYDRFETCDAVAVLGYGFNKDDSHINTIFRELARKGTKVFVFQYAPEGLGEVEKQRIKRNLRIENPGNVVVAALDQQRCVEDQLWTEFLAVQVCRCD